jgi:hypothetical protein
MMGKHMVNSFPIGDIEVYTQQAIRFVRVLCTDVRGGDRDAAEWAGR